MTAQLTPAMEAALGFVLDARPGSVHTKDRESERWLRMERRPTVDALVRRGLAVQCYRDWPDGWCAELTDAGLVERARVRAERAR